MPPPDVSDNAHLAQQQQQHRQAAVMTLPSLTVSDPRHQIQQLSLVSPMRQQERRLSASQHYVVGLFRSSTARTSVCVSVPHTAFCASIHQTTDVGTTALHESGRPPHTSCCCKDTA
jgi:hypothetical protein